MTKGHYIAAFFVLLAATLLGVRLGAQLQTGDWAQLSRYRDANRLLAPPNPEQKRIILLGDSITELWNIATLPVPKQWELLNRGISGQVTMQMRMRFPDDVLALHPSTVVLLGGTNDAFVGKGDMRAAEPAILEKFEANVTAIADLADRNAVKLVLCTIPPIGEDSERLRHDPHTITAANIWLKTFAKARGYPVADYHAALADKGGALPLRLSSDGIHPTEQGYARMWPVLKAAIETAVR